MWEFGYTEWIPEDSSKNGDDDPVMPKQTIWGECSTFSEAIDMLYGYVADMVKRGNSVIGPVLADIRLIMDDPGIRSDPDQWEDMDFYTKSDKEFFVAQS